MGSMSLLSDYHKRGYYHGINYRELALLLQNSTRGLLQWCFQHWGNMARPSGKERGAVLWVRADDGKQPPNLLCGKGFGDDWPGAPN